MQFIKNNKREFITLFILIFFSNDTLLFGTNENKAFFWFHIGVLLFLAAYWLLITKKFSGSNLFKLFFMILLVGLTCLLNLDLNIKYPYEIFMFIISLLIVINIPKEKFIYSFNIVISILSIGATVVVALFYLMPNVLNIFPVITNTVDMDFRYVIFNFIPVDQSTSSILRMYGIFREPGVYIIFLIMAFVFEFLMLKNKSIIRIVSYVIGGFLTFSTAGYITLMLAYVLILANLLFKRNKYAKKLILISLLILVLAIVGIISIGWDRIYGLVFKKLTTDNDSFNARFGSIFTNIRMALRNLFFGNGFTFVEDNFYKYASLTSMASRHNTNTVLKILAVHGIIFFAIYLFGMF